MTRTDTNTDVHCMPRRQRYPKGNVFKWHFIRCWSQVNSVKAVKTEYKNRKYDAKMQMVSLSHYKDW